MLANQTEKDLPAGHGYIDSLFTSGGQGASDGADGKSALMWPTSAANTPIELFESRTPALVLEKAFCADSGGAGRRRGGLGQVVRFRKLASESGREGVRPRMHTKNTLLLRSSGRRGGVRRRGDLRAAASSVRPGGRTPGSADGSEVHQHGQVCERARFGDATGVGSPANDRTAAGQPSAAGPPGTSGRPSRRLARLTSSQVSRLRDGSRSR